MTVATQQARMVRPFPTKALADALYHVEADSHEISQQLFAVLADPPRMLEEWLAALERMEAAVVSLQARCGDVLPVLAGMVDRADGDWQRALDALVAIFAAIKAEPLAEAA